MSKMLNEIKPLLFRAVPYEDESLPGYILRLTDLNDYESTAWILWMAHLREFTRRRIVSLCLKPKANLTGLAVLSGAREDAIRALQYQPTSIVKSRLMGDYDAFGNSLPLYTIRIQNPKLCPLCLREQPYIRKVWDLGMVTACPIHSCLLLGGCPSCGKPFSWFRKRVCECVRCGLDWRKVEPSTVPAHELAVSWNFHRLCGLSCGADLPSGDEGKNRLLDLDLRTFMRSLLFVASQFDGRIDTTGKSFVPKQGNAHLHELLIKGFHVFDDFPRNFYQFLDWRRVNPGPSIGSKHPNVKGWAKTFYGYKSALFMQMVAPEFDFLRNAFNDYIRQSKYESALSLVVAANAPDPSAELAALREKIGNAPEDVMSLKQAQDALGLAESSVEKLIDSGTIKAAVGRQGLSGGRVFLINRSSVEKLKVQLRSILTLQQLQKFLGLSAKQTRELIEGGVLKGIYRDSINKKRTWLILECEARRLIDEIVSSTTLIAKSKYAQTVKGDSSVCSFQLALSLLRRIGYGMRDLVNMITSGRLRVYRKGGHFSFRTLEFETADLLKTISPEYEQTYSIPHTATLLNVPQRKVAFFIKAGILKAKTFPGCKGGGIRVHEDDLQEFLDTYVTSCELLRATHATLDDIETYLDKHDIKPTIKPNRTGGFSEMVFVLRRSLVNVGDLKPNCAESRHGIYTVS